MVFSRLRLSLASVILSWLGAAQVLAQAPAGEGVAPSTAQEALPAPAPTSPTPAPLPRLSAEQLESFADLTGDSTRAVAYRLSREPQLVPLAASAADARRSRRSSGKVMAVTGFVILGVGDIIGTAIIVTTPGYPEVESGHEKRILLGAGIGVVALAIGLGLAIPGLIRMARETEVETRARESYRPSGPSELSSLQTLSPQLSPIAASLYSPILSGRF